MSWIRNTDLNDDLAEDRKKILFTLQFTLVRIYSLYVLYFLAL